MLVAEQYSPFLSAELIWVECRLAEVGTAVSCQASTEADNHCRMQLSLGPCEQQSFHPMRKPT